MTGRRLTRYLAGLAEVCGQAGQTEEGLTLVAEAQAFVEKTGQRLMEAEIYRVKGELLLRQGAPDVAIEAEACYWQAVEVARQQRAKSWELRATMSLCRLWRKRGRQKEARRMPEEIYGWFTEGFDTQDMREAKALLDELSNENQNSKNRPGAR